MIHSATYENWTRVKLMHELAENLYNITKNTAARSKLLNRSMEDGFFFDVNSFRTMQNESYIVGMIIVWCVVTLESYVNHALAEKVSDKEFAIQAIEHARDLRKKYKGCGSMNSELSVKIAVLNDFKSEIRGLLEIADKIVLIRNSIVHDKPFSLNDSADGDVRIEYFRSRNSADYKTFRFSDLKGIYADCQSIIEFLKPFDVSISYSENDIDFPSLFSEEDNGK